MLHALRYLKPANASLVSGNLDEMASGGGNGAFVASELLNRCGHAQPEREACDVELDKVQ